jgi:hypothetical protein
MSIGYAIKYRGSTHVAALSHRVTAWDLLAYPVVIQRGIGRADTSPSGRIGCGAKKQVAPTVQSDSARAFLLASLLLLAGCDAIGPWFHGPAAPEEPATSTDEHLPLPPPPAPRAPSLSANAAASQPPVVVDGLSGDAVRTLLGPPLTQVAVGPGETWTYRSGACEVQLFLFPDVSNGGLHVLDHHANGAGSRAADQQTCLRRMHHDHGI